jgi:hypothetical protein
MVNDNIYGTRNTIPKKYLHNISSILNIKIYSKNFIKFLVKFF